MPADLRYGPSFISSQHTESNPAGFSVSTFVVFRRLRGHRLLGKALSERHQQLEWAIEPNLPPQQCPHHVFFLPQKADPRLRVSGNVQIGLADMPLFHADLLLLNHDSCLPLLMAGEGEVERGVQSRRLAGLEDVWHSFQENLDGVRPQAVARRA